MVVVAFELMTKRFHVPVGSCTFKTQFAQLYTSRLASARPALEAIAHSHWANLPLHSLVSLTIDEECVIIGTLYKVCGYSFIFQFVLNDD